MLPTYPIRTASEGTPGARDSRGGRPSASPARALPDAAAQPSVASPPLVGRRAVVVEDEGVIRMQLGRLLARAGLSVVATAGNGPEGVAAALRELPDLILMDVSMPGGEFDGLEAARRILAERDVCVVILTGLGENVYEAEARAVGASGYVVKPFIQETLIAQLEAAYRRWEKQGDGGADGTGESGAATGEQGKDPPPGGGGQ